MVRSFAVALLLLCCLLTTPATAVGTDVVAQAAPPVSDGGGPMGPGGSPSLPGARASDPAPSNPTDPTPTTGDASDDDDDAPAEPPAVDPPATDAEGLSLDPIAMTQDVVEWVSTAAMEEAAAQIDWINEIVSGMPAPGEPTDPGSWTAPENGLWPGVYDATQLTMPLAVVLLLLGTMRAFVTSNAYKRREQFRRVAVAFVLVLLTWVIAPLGLHIGGTIGTALHPSGSEFIDTPGNFAKLSVGLIFGAALAILYSSVVVIGILVLAIQYFLVHVVVFFWPLAWATWSLGGYGESLGNLNHYLFLTLIVLNVVQSMLLRLLFELPWGSSDAVSALMAFLATTGGLVVALVLIPLTLLKQATTGAAVGLGVSAGTQAVSQAAPAVRERATSAVARVRSSPSQRTESDDDDLPNW